MNNDVQCPYCGAGQEICHDDGQGYAEDETHSQECDVCNKIFVFTTAISFSYDVRKADCLNGGEHLYEATMTYPIEYTRMKCKYCNCERPCTESEMQSIILKEE